MTHEYENRSVADEEEQCTKHGHYGAMLDRQEDLDDVRLSESENIEVHNGCCHNVLCDVIYPSGFFFELKKLCTLSVPIVLTQICQMAIGPISLIFCGHLGDKILLDGAALAISVINATCIGVGQGLGTACDTFFSQTYGSRNKKQVGVYVQRAVLIFLLAIMPCFAFHLNIESFLLIVGQNPDVSRLVARYLLIFMPGGLSFFMYVIVSKYIQNQNIVIPNVIIGTVANIVNALLHYLFLYYFTWGTEGSAIAMTISYFLMFSMTLAYILVTGIYKDTWNGWSILALQEWGKFVRLCVPGMLMLCMEWWAFEIGVFITGLLGTVELGAQAVLLQLDSIWFQVPLGIQIACAIRVGQDVGSGNTLGAITVSRMALTIVMSLSVITVILFLVLPHHLPYLFTNVSEVVDLVAKLMPIVAIYVFFDGIATASKGILYGTGRQLYGAILMFVTYYILALPIGISLIFRTSLRTAGYWWALAGNLVIQAVCLLVIVFQTDWAEEVIKARERAGLLGELYYDPVDQEEETEALLSESRSVSPSSSSSPPVPGRRRRLLSSSLTLSAVQVVVEESTELSPVALLCRRLTALLVMSVILMVGITCKLLYTYEVKTAHHGVNVTTVTAPEWPNVTTVMAPEWQNVTNVSTTSPGLLSYH